MLKQNGDWNPGRGEQLPKNKRPLHGFKLTTEISLATFIGETDKKKKRFTRTVGLSHKACQIEEQKMKKRGARGVGGVWFIV